jgi:hypothetical protein
MYRFFLLGLWSCILVSAPLHADVAAPWTCYVAHDGQDSAEGSREAPFATVQRALDAAADVSRTDPTAEVVIHLLPGTYRIEKPLRVAAPLAKVRLAAVEPGEGARPILSGGRPITGWQAGENNRWTVSLPQVASGDWHFRQLWKDGARLSRARFPKGDAVLTLEEVGDDAKSFTLSESIPGGDLAGQDAELVVIQNWSIARVAVTRSEGALVETKDPAGWMGHDMCTASPGKPAFLEHALAFLDEPGEWYLDRKTGLLTYQAAPGEDPNAHEFIAPVAEQWLVVEGTPEAPIQVTVSGIDFQHAAWPLPETGYQGIQAGHFGPSIRQPVSVLPGAVELSWVRDSLFHECRFSHTGASGMVFGAGSRATSVTNSAFDDIGGNGIMVGWRQPYFDAMGGGGDHSLASDWPEAAMAPEHIGIRHCTLTRAGAQLWGAVGLFDAFSRGTAMAHNEVHDMPYTGISIGFRWNSSETSQRDTQVLRNHVHDVMQKLADGGCIYTLGLQPGAVLEGNLLHGVPRSTYAHGGAPNNGIFFDEGSKGLHVKDNIIYDTSGEPIRFNQTSAENLTFETNYFGVAPDDPAFPKDLADKAGRTPKGD